MPDLILHNSLPIWGCSLRLASGTPRSLLLGPDRVFLLLPPLPIPAAGCNSLTLSESHRLSLERCPEKEEIFLGEEGALGAGIEYSWGHVHMRKGALSYPRVQGRESSLEIR